MLEHNPDVPRQHRLAPNWHLAAQWLLGFTVAILVQKYLRQSGAEFWHTDDGAHYVSSAMVAQWLSTGFGLPLDVAVDYNSHYPLVSIGLWGPAFYCVFGLFLSVMGGGQEVALGLTAAVFASLAAVTGKAVAKIAEMPLSWAASMLIVALPISVDQTLAFGLDGPVALTFFGATFALGHWLVAQTRRSLQLFVLLAWACLLTKGNALALFICMPLLLLLTRKLSTLSNWRIWIAALAVTVVAVTWYAFSYTLAASGFREAWGWAFTSKAIGANLQLLYATTGPVLLALATLGTWIGLRRGGWGAVSLAGAVSIFIFQSIVPASINARYLLPMLPFVLVLAALGAQVIGEKLPSFKSITSFPVGLLSLTVILSLSVATLKYPSIKLYHGITGAAQEVKNLLPAGNRSVLVVGFDVVETSFISVSSMLQPINPDIYIIRGSRLLGAGGYNNFQYTPRFDSVEDIKTELSKYSIPVIVISTASHSQNWAHIAQVQELIDRPEMGWHLEWRGNGSDDVRIYINKMNMQLAGAHGLVKELSKPRRLDLSR
jgi:hypothetical protein